MYPIQDVADMLGLTLDQMAMMGSLVENDFMKHATHLKEFHYRIGVLRHPMDTVVCVGKYLKEGGSQHPDDIFMAETDQTVRSAYSERLRQSVLQYNRPQIDTCFRLRGEEASAAIKALPSEVRTSATVLCLMPIAVGGIMVLVRPDYLLPLIEEDLGQKMLFVTTSLYVAGIVTMRRITKVDM